MSLSAVLDQVVENQTDPKEDVLRTYVTRQLENHKKHKLVVFDIPSMINGQSISLARRIVLLDEIFAKVKDMAIFVSIAQCSRQVDPSINRNTIYDYQTYYNNPLSNNDKQALLQYQIALKFKNNPLHSDIFQHEQGTITGKDLKRIVK